jgi:hypothetical protein
MVGLVLITFVPGVALVIAGIAKGRRQARLLERGRIASTTLQEERRKQEGLVVYELHEGGSAVRVDDLPARLEVGPDGLLDAAGLRPVWTIALVLFALVGTIASILVVL